MKDLGQARAVIVVFAMPGCPACEEYLPKLDRWVQAHRRVGHPFEYYDLQRGVRDGAIPIAIIDITSPDPGIQAYADQNRLNAMPTTLSFVRGRTVARHEGGLEDREIDQLLAGAVIANQ
jgi:thiol-disulfide isomerase/thioredoxin